LKKPNLVSRKSTTTLKENQQLMQYRKFKQTINHRNSNLMSWLRLLAKRNKNLALFLNSLFKQFQLFRQDL